MDVHLQHPRVRPRSHLPLNRTQSGESVFLYQKVAPPARKEAGVRPCPSRIGICNVLQRILKHFVKSHALPTKIGRSAGKHCLTHCTKPTSSASSILMCSLLGPILLILGFFMKMKICRAEVCEPSMLMSAGVIANASPGLSIPKKATRMQKATSGQSQCNAKVTKARNTCSGMGQCEWLEEAAFQDQARSQAKGKCPRSSSAMSVTALSVSEKLSRERWASQEWKPKSRSNRSICLGSRQRKALNVMFL